MSAAEVGLLPWRTRGEFHPIPCRTVGPEPGASCREEWRRWIVYQVVGAPATLVPSAVLPPDGLLAGRRPLPGEVLPPPAQPRPVAFTPLRRQTGRPPFRAGWRITLK